MLIAVTQVEAVAASGRKRLEVPPGAVVTPLAEERAEELGIELSGARARGDGSPGDDSWEVEVRRLVRAVLDRLGESHEREEAVTAEVLRRLGGRCGCPRRRG